MPQRTSKKVVGTLRDVDDLVFLITGKRIKNLVTRGLDLFGNEVKRKVVGEEPVSEDPADPYNVLEVRRNASDLVVKASFRAKARELHPDTGLHPDPRGFQRATEAYDQIMAARKEKSGV